MSSLIKLVASDLTCFCSQSLVDIKMSYFVLEKNSVGETLKFPICAECEETINVAIPKSQDFPGFRRFDNSNSRTITEYSARQGCAVCRLILAIFQSADHLPNNLANPGRVAVSSMQTLPFSGPHKYADITILRPKLGTFKILVVACC